MQNLASGSFWYSMQEQYLSKATVLDTELLVKDSTD